MKVYLVAGEASGDALGAALMSGLRALAPDVVFRGVAGTAMQAEGMTSLFPMSELSVMGLAEVLPRYLDLRRRLHQTARDVIDWQPDVLITIDSPDFCLRVARLVHAAGSTRLVHYVAPSVWAWRPGRAAKMARHIDQVLCLLPFEPPLMQAAGMRADFVGHPVVAEPQADAAAIAAFRAAHGIADAPLILALPGSRRGEIARLAPVLGEALGHILSRRPEARLAVVAAHPTAGFMAEQIRDWPGAPILLDPRSASANAARAQKRAAFAAADMALAASGTVSLELAAARTPMVIAYDMNWLSRRIIAAMLRIDTVTLVNLVSDSRAVPEFLGDKCRPGPIAEAALAVLEAPQAQLAALDLTMTRLGRGGEAPGLRAARAVLEGLG